jgi:SAM-dependent MidA family methyltransferase
VERLVAEATDPVAHVRLAGEARRLLLPAEMGEAFKVMALTRDHGEALQGFTLQDLRQSL